jgi:MFS transporter, YNFM family, putative membrane transport protein
MRAVPALMVVLLATEAAMWSLIAPLLPAYGEAFRLSQDGIGVLGGMYVAAVAASAMLALGPLRAWAPRTSLTVGLAVLSAATVAFALAPDVLVLTIARAAQGLAGGQVWVGASSVLAHSSPPARRGLASGLTAGGAALGTVVGPVIGTAAVATDPTVALLVVAVALLLLLIPCRLDLASDRPAPLTDDNPPFRSRVRALALPLSVVAALSFPIGLAVAVGPTRLATLSVSHVHIGVVFLFASLLGVVVSPAVGRITADTWRRHALHLGLILVGASVLPLCLADWPWLISVALVVLIGAGYAMALPLAFSLLQQRLTASGPTTAAALNLITMTITEAIGSMGGAALLGASPVATVALLMVGPVGLAAAAIWRGTSV